MSMKQTQHAANLVSSFRSRLPEELIAQIGEQHFDELALIAESAISSAVLEELEKAADRMDKLAHEIRHFAEHFDN